MQPRVHRIATSALNAEHLDFSLVGNKAVGALCSVGGNAGYTRGQSDLQYLTVNVTKNVQQTYRIAGTETCSTPSGLTESGSAYLKRKGDTIEILAPVTSR